LVCPLGSTGSQPEPILHLPCPVLGPSSLLQDCLPMELPVPEYTIVVYSVMAAIIDALEFLDIPLLKMLRR